MSRFSVRKQLLLSQMVVPGCTSIVRSVGEDIHR
jgi:hypothetical protein